MQVISFIKSNIASSFRTIETHIVQQVRSVTYHQTKPESHLMSYPQIIKSSHHKEARAYHLKCKSCKQINRSLIHPRRKCQKEYTSLRSKREPPPGGIIVIIQSLDLIRPSNPWPVFL